ncbi:GNAT family N-acetyltransferase [Enterococcus sp. LJL128]|uniref:GNAT family N-acetyltransferase n=1 Tax=Enterococcus sp. LJL51 TaxID=3416656 RepID=UPI003CF4BAAA
MIKKIRNHRGELSEALGLVWRTFMEFEAVDYSNQGVQEFKSFISLPEISKKLENNELFIWGYYEKSKLLGVIAVREPFHISLLFVDKAYHRQGIARRLYSKMIEDYSKNTNCQIVTVNSSPYAVEAYLKLGFTAAGTEKVINGIRFIPMERNLSDK